MLSIPVVENSTIDITDLTHSTVAGDGAFDRMMRATKAHLEQEWTLGRIKGNEYATIYLGALQTTLQAAIQFVLTKNKVNLENQLLEQQKEKLLAEVALLNQQVLNLAAEGLNIPKQGVLLDKQATKLDSEIELLEQKTISEKAQVDFTGVEADSMLGRQATVYKNQADGFLRQAEQQAAKIVVDFYGAAVLADSTLLNYVDDANLDASEIGKVITKLHAGIGSTTTV